MRIPHKWLKDARDHARLKANETGRPWYVNRLASSGPMHYEVAEAPITDTSAGGGLVSVIHPDDPAPVEHRWTMNNMLAGDTEPGHFPEDVEPEDPRDEEEAAFDRAAAREVAPFVPGREEVDF